MVKKGSYPGDLRAGLVTRSSPRVTTSLPPWSRPCARPHAAEGHAVVAVEHLIQATVLVIWVHASSSCPCQLGGSGSA
jgi:hypothetical protein